MDTVMTWAGSAAALGVLLVMLASGWVGTGDGEPVPVPAGGEDG